MSKRRSLGALVIGCGTIAGAGARPVDEGGPPTHADAYDRHPNFHIAACVEPDQTRRAAFMRQWRIAHGFDDLASCLAAGIEFDIASLCTPTPAHGADLLRLLDTPVRAVLCEKPLTDDATVSARITAAYDDAGKPLAVAYLRRWIPAIAALKQEFAAGEWGQLRAISGIYTKGALNNGSHLLDLIAFLFGQPTLAAVTGQRIDAAANDPTVDAALTLADGVPVHLIGADARDYALFELSLIAERGRVDIERSGRAIRRRRRIDDPDHAGYQILNQGKWCEHDHGDALYRALDNLHDAITQGATLASSAHSALATQRLCEAMIDGARRL